MNSKTRWQRAELLFFTVVAIVNIVPYVSARFFPGMDSASHLANANIINQLLFHNNDLFHQFFRINPEPVPNWTSHLFLSVVSLLMPVFFAEKLLIIILMAGIPFAFRRLVLYTAPGNVFYSYLVFPFTHSMFLFFGFYNFCSGVLFMLIALLFWLRQEERSWTVTRFVVLFLLLALTYFSHILVFGVLLILLAVNLKTRSLMAWSAGRPFRRLATDFLRKAGILIAASAIPLALFGYFFITRPGTRELKFIPKTELLEYLYTIRPLITFNVSVESKPNMVLFGIIVLLLLSGAAFYIFSLFRKKGAEVQGSAAITPAGFMNGHTLWIGLSLALLLLLYFLLPDAYGTASYTNLRLAFFIFILALLWIATFRLPKVFGILAMAAGIAVNLFMNQVYSPSLRDLSHLSEITYRASEKVKPNSIVLPIYTMDNWFTGHFVDYLAVDKPVVMVYNYECESGYFPVIWNAERKPNYSIGTPDNEDQYINFELIKGRASLPVDYIFILGPHDQKKDWFFTTLHNVLAGDFTCVYQVENCFLYQRNTTR